MPLMLGLPSSGKRADTLVVVEFADGAVVGAQPFHGFADGDFFLALIIAHAVEIALS